MYFITYEALKSENLYQVRVLHHNDWPTPDITPSFSVRFVSLINDFGGFSIYLYATYNYVKDIRKGIDSNLRDK